MSEGFRNTTGRCIYCGSTKSPLTSEHIVPAGLNGAWTILDASCSACATITSQFEGEVLRDCLQAQRAALGLRSRRKKNVPSEFPVAVSSESGLIDSVAPTERYPAIIPLPILGRSSPDQEEVEVLDFVVINIDEASERALSLAAATVEPEELGTGTERTVEVQVRVRPFPFARMIAKIGYCFAVAASGVTALDDPGLVAFILGQTERTGKYLGSSTPGSVTETALHTHDVDVQNDIVRVRFRIFASYGGLGYDVLVRRARSN
jgi:hypothetical protein